MTVFAAYDFQYIFPSVCGSSGHDGQRSSLFVQLQPVSESLFTLVICTDITEISSDLCDASAAEIPLNILLLVCFHSSV